jgi:hypothetical protein
MANHLWKLELAKKTAPAVKRVFEPTALTKLYELGSVKYGQLIISTCRTD